MTEPTTWTIERIVKVVDGDTVHVIRSRVVQLGDDWFELVDVAAKKCRLVYVNTPERGEGGWSEARADLATWIEARSVGLRAVCHYPDHFGRMLVDLHDSDGNSASQWLMREKGWASYAS